MKTTLLALLTAAAIQSAVSQTNPIPNADFENWTGTQLNGWYALSVAGCSKSTTPHSGSFALKMVPWSGSMYGANVFVPANGGFPLNGLNPTSLTGWYMGNFVNGDQVEVIVSVYSGGSATGSGFALINTSAAAYTQFTVPIYNSGATADSARIQFMEITSSYSPSGLNAATTFTMDDLQMTGTVGIQSYKSNSAGVTVFPNPSRDGMFSVRTEKALAENAELKVISASGTEVMKVNAAQAYKDEAYALNLKSCSPGVYFLFIQTGNATEVKRIVVLD